MALRGVYKLTGIVDNPVLLCCKILEAIEKLKSLHQVIFLSRINFYAQRIWNISEFYVYIKYKHFHSLFTSFFAIQLHHLQTQKV